MTDRATSPHLRLVLASASPRRLELLRQIGLDPLVDPSTVDEILPEGVDAATAARRLAEAKGREVATRHDPATTVVLAADTVVCVGTAVLGKPADEDDAVRMLRALSGATHEVHTGLWVRGPHGEVADTATTHVRFRRLADEEIRAYVDTGEALDKAGAYGIQGRAASFVEHVDGEYSNVVGLPLGLVTRLLAGAGIRLHERWSGR